MDRKTLDQFLAERGLKVDDGHFPHGNSNNRFCDLYAGTGQPYQTLDKTAKELNEQGVTARITTVTNPEHPDHGKLMLELPSYWNE